MIIYRAMCEEEYVNTVKSGKPIFQKRFKWFSQNLDWIKSRVQDNKFNNSKFKPNKYTHICSFKWDELKADWVHKHEIQFDVRKNPNIKFIELITINHKDLTCKEQHINYQKDRIPNSKFQNDQKVCE